ncbi:MAG TPA: UDP-N-acetylmuramoylalanyl-D-glutamate--2,6-diaminopimelate ligase [Treponema sp.]|nr:UDP-N-acetylmuramoylalanyl-D-glutamate--2,6-diaminopimelate ligase [Treponema sp.]
MEAEIESLLTLEDVLESTGGVHVLGSGDFHFSSVQTDSRQIEKNSLFVPLIGENQDGHKYVPQAVEKGASVVFVAMPVYEKNPDFFNKVSMENPSVFFIAVENTLHALQAAASRYVEKFPDLIRIGVTGSSGKTTTKEILASILQQKYRVITNLGNLNSETGLPLSVFNIRKEHQVGLFEMGMNRKDEMAEISAVLKPRFAVITNIGTAHIGNLGSRENIASEKGRIFDHFHSFGTAVIPRDDDFADFLASLVDGNIVFYGDGEDEGISFVADHGLDGTEFTVDGKKAVLPLPGKYNYKNALGAIALSRVLGVSSEQIVEGISNLHPLFGRSQVIHGDYIIVQDCYNANPDSMEKAIEFVSSVSGKNKVFVLGDMLELGEESKTAHQKIGLMAKDSGASLVVFAGDEMKEAYNAARDLCRCVYIEGHSDESMKKISDAVRSSCEKGSVVLIKGSRGMGLERVTSLLGGNA